MWILIAVAVVAIIGVIYWVTKGKEARLNQRRETAAEHRQEAQVAAQRAGQADVEARRVSQQAEAERDRAIELEEKAAATDPDTESVRR
jgi:hypothetical protein